MMAERVKAAQENVGPLAECFLALLGQRDPEDDATDRDIRAGAFVLAESLSMWRRSVSKRR